MDQMPNVVIIMSHCSRSRESFGIRFEEQGRGMWVADWAFPVRDTLARKEGYDHAEIKGTFAFDGKYPGCPYCGSISLIFCPRCERVSCYDGKSANVSCGWCSFSSQIGGSSVGGLKAGGDLL
jgi:hypothetical protein